MNVIAKWTMLAVIGTGLLAIEAAGVRHAVLGVSEWVASGRAENVARAGRIAATDAGRAIAREARATALAAAMGALEGVGTVYAATQGPQPREVRMRVIEVAPCPAPSATPAHYSDQS